MYSKTGAYCGEVDAELTPDGVRMAKAFADAYRSVAWTAGRLCQPDETHHRNRAAIV
jgi:broad specificity phosphatase PhoE